MNPTTPHPYRHWTIYLGLFLSAICLFTALRIEWFNANAPTKLPVPPGSGKWRYFASPSALKELTENRYRTTHNLPDDSAFTLHQQNEIEIHFQNSLKRYELDNDFLVFIASFGLLQYLLVPSLFFLGIYTGLTSPQRNRLAIPFTLIAALCGLLMLHRGYFSALGW